MPTPDEHLGPLTAAFSEVTESSFFAIAEPCDAAQFGELVDGTPGGWMQAAVSFTGAFAGAVTLQLPEALARDLLAAFMGFDAEGEPGDPQVFDAVGELANMACGDWLTHVSGQRRFDLRPPVVTRLAPAWRPESGSDRHDGATGRALLAVAGMPLVLTVAFQAA